MVLMLRLIVYVSVNNIDSLQMEKEQQPPACARLMTM